MRGTCPICKGKRRSDCSVKLQWRRTIRTSPLKTRALSSKAHARVDKEKEYSIGRSKWPIKLINPWLQGSWCNPISGGGRKISFIILGLGLSWVSHGLWSASANNLDLDHMNPSSFEKYKEPPQMHNYKHLSVRPISSSEYPHWYARDLT